MVDQPRTNPQGERQGTAPVTPDTPIYSYNEMQAALAEARKNAAWAWADIVVIFGLGVMVGILLGSWLVGG